MKWKIPVILSLFILFTYCKKDDPEPEPIIKYGPIAGELHYIDLTDLKEASSAQVKTIAPGGILLDTVIYNDPRLVYGLLPENLGMEANLTMSYIFHHDSLMRIIFRDTTTLLNFELAQELSELAQESISLDSIRHFIALEGDIAAQVFEFPSIDSLWGYVYANDIRKEEIEVLSSIWRNSNCILSVSYAGDIDLATGQICFIDSTGKTRGASTFRKHQYPTVWECY